MKRTIWWIPLLLILWAGCGSDRADKEVKVPVENTALAPSGGVADETFSHIGSVTFDVISRSDTIKDADGRYRDHGHFSIVARALRTQDKTPVTVFDRNTTTNMYENGHLRDEAKVVVSGAPKEVGDQILLLLDFSSSVIGDCDQVDVVRRSGAEDTVRNTGELQENTCYTLVESAKRFIRQTVTSGQKMAIYYFDARQEIHALATSTTASTTDEVSILIDGIEKLYDPAFRSEALQGYYSTNLYGAVIEATKVACHWSDSCNYDIYHPNTQVDKSHLSFSSIVLFTDGRDLAHRVSEQEMKEFIGRHPAIYFFSIGLGEDVDERALREIGRSGYAKANNLGDLDRTFQTIATTLNALGRSFYRIDYCPATQQGEIEVRIELFGPREAHGTVTDHISMPEGEDIRCDL